jgi:glycosyltransferase involved in cell wall biosynthesis
MKPTTVKVLHTFGALNPGGVETWLRQIVKHMEPERIELNFCTFGPQPGIYDEEVKKVGVKVIRCSRTSNLLYFELRFRRILREGGYQVVHSHVHLFSGMILRWAKAEGVPIRIAHSHSTRDDKPDTPLRRHYCRLMKSWIQSYATHGLATSADAAAALFGEEWQSDRRFRVFHFGIDLLPFQGPIVKEDVRREFGLARGAPIVGHVASFVPRKNHRFILKIAAESIRQRPDLHFLLVGDGQLREETEAEVRSKGLWSNIHFVGLRTDVPRLMRGAMDAFLFPSLWEGLPLALLEAQAAGLPCVFSDSITPEIEILPGQMIPMSLSRNAGDWAAATLAAVQQNRIDSQDALKAFNGTDFCLQGNSSILSELYTGNYA